MAKNDVDNAAKDVDSKINDLAASLNTMYQKTYQSRVDDKRDMDRIVNGIDNSIDSLLSKINGQKASDLSTVYTRLNGRNMDNFEDQMSKLFNDSGEILDTINVDNIRKSIQAEDYQYDLICQYMTKLEDALEIKKDNVLSSDNFTKDFINVISGRSSEEYISTFSDKAEVVKQKYDLENLFDEIYYETSKYGEYFLYLVPYKKAFERLLKRKQYNFAHSGFMNTLHNESAEVMNESPETFGGECIFEGAHFNGEIGDKTLNKEFINEIKSNDMKVNLFFDTSGIIPEPIEAVKEINEAKSKHKSITESYYTESNTDTSTLLGVNMSDFTKATSLDGTFNKDNPDIKIKEMNGAVCYKIPRDQIFPVCMMDSVIGYIYLTVSNTYVENLVINGYSYNSLTNNTKLMADEYDRENDAFVGYIASMISDKIDANFINSNVDLKDQIFSILRYNDKFNAISGVNNIGISFIPADDVRHCYFKLDKNTHRGISDLKKSIVPAMIYCMLYLNDAIGRMTRANDKRVYYVKQNVEQNVSRTLLNVVNQLKKGNMGMRQLENMNTIFNCIGRYNDHIVPISQSGDKPIEMEVMQGQQIDTPTDLMDRMEDQAVTATDVPLEFIQSVQAVDYATRFTMSNSKFLRKVYKRQSICQNIFSDIFRRLYNYEYGENNQTIKIALPTPTFMALTNAQTLFDNTKNYASGIIEMLEPDMPDEEKHRFINLYCRDQLGTYLNFNKIDNMIKSAKIDHKVTSAGDLGAGENYDDEGDEDGY